MREASETSGEESKDKEVTGAHKGTQGWQSQWTEHHPVKQLRQQEPTALEAKNDTSLGAILGEDHPEVERMKARQRTAKWLRI